MAHTVLLAMTRPDGIRTCRGTRGRADGAEADGPTAGTGGSKRAGHGGESADEFRGREEFRWRMDTRDAVSRRKGGFVVLVDAPVVRITEIGTRLPHVRDQFVRMGPDAAAGEKRSRSLAGKVPRAARPSRRDRPYASPAAGTAYPATDGQRTVSTVESSSATHEWSTPLPHTT